MMFIKYTFNEDEIKDIIAKYIEESLGENGNEFEINLVISNDATQISATAEAKSEINV